jgi:hypothetical protein
MRPEQVQQFDNPVGAQQYWSRHFNADRPGGLRVMISQALAGGSGSRTTVKHRPIALVFVREIDGLVGPWREPHVGHQLVFRWTAAFNINCKAIFLALPIEDVAMSHGPSDFGRRDGHAELQRNIDFAWLIFHIAAG